MMAIGQTPGEWRQRLKIFAQRFWQPTSACLTCMPGSLGNIWSGAHWATALHTGLATGILAVLLSFTPLGKLYKNPYGNALIVGVLTALGDAYSHAGHYGGFFAEAALTGVVSGLIALGSFFLLEDRARRLRALLAKARRPR